MNTRGVAKCLVNCALSAVIVLPCCLVGCDLPNTLAAP